MAKNFKYITDQNICTDECTYISIEGVKIGSIMCHRYCSNCKDYNYESETLSCTKIIYRNQITGKVVMRKPTP